MILTKIKEIQNDLKEISIKIIISFFIILFFQIILLFISFFYDNNWLRYQIIGTIFGSTEAFINLFLLGISMYMLMIKNSSRLMMILPIAGFIGMCLSAFFFSYNFLEGILGFAVGLSFPIIFFCFIVFI